MRLPDQPDAWIDWDAMTLADGDRTLPIREMLTRTGKLTKDRDEAEILVAGEGDRWVSAKVLRNVGTA